MSINLVRMRFAAVAVKIETTPGQDAIGGTPANSDFIAADCEIEYDPVVVDNPELTGTLDKSPGIVGGLRPRIRIKVPLRGSGTAATGQGTAHGRVQIRIRVGVSGAVSARQNG